MSNSRKTFMKAGGILGIISAAFMILIGLMLFAGMQLMTYEFVVETLTEQGVIAEYSEEMIQTILTISKTIYGVMLVFILGLAAANLALSIKVIKQANAGSMKKGCIIALLVVSLFSANVITFAFMITALCLNKSPETPVVVGTEHDEQFSN